MAIGMLMPQAGGNPERFRTDFGGYAIGSAPNDWTAWAIDGSPSIVSAAGSLSGKAFQFSNSGGDNRWTWNKVPANKPDVEILTRGRQMSPGDTKPINGLFVRGSALAGSMNGYQGQSRYRTASTYDTHVYVRRITGGATTDLSVPEGPAPVYSGSSPTPWLWMRFRIQGSTITIKLWQDGQAEPASWLGTTVTDSTYTSGYSGLWFAGGAPMPVIQVDYYSVALNGKTAL